MTATPVRHLVLDSEAASALLATSSRNRKRAAVIAAVMAANGRTVVPTVVRVEAGWERRDPQAANANRLVPEDAPLDRHAADRAVALRRPVRRASVVDAAVVATAERLPPADVVHVLTSDPRDLQALAAHSDAPLHITRI